MKNKIITKLILVIALCFSAQVPMLAQSRSNQAIQVIVAPDKADWTYAPGEKIKFTATVLKNHIPIKNIEASYTIGLEKMSADQKGKVKIDKETIQIGKQLSLDTPGFIRCNVTVKIDGEEYRGFATAAISPEKIQPTQTLPKDFQEFWNNELEKSKILPLDINYTLLPERSTSNVDVFHISYKNIDNSLMYGILAKPKKDGKYPAILHVPGAGIRPYAGIIDLAEQGFVTLQVGIHGISVINDISLYNNLSTGALRGYQYNNLDNKDTYYYKRVYIGCSRGVDVLASLKEVDPSNIVVWGGSQGGTLAITTTALNKKVKGLVALYPAMCDLTGYLHKRAGGWPHMFNESNVTTMATQQKIETSGYYDVVNFARQITVPGFYTWGYNDETCPPTSYYAAYNQIKSSKELYLVQETGHWTYPEQYTKINNWVKDFVKK
ncbi:acetylxylan esterase [Sphingobacterium bovistauri]|uniref:Acetylxylan esterase n=1 Tax=Sphingobacterium bovistauri TaxID=2781959 RepID=A0ABS7Z298_9SPHI|nr:acetylxylan esterase [Sphingobacterium bovistauri]MCA5004282.1 acetylxylan esterase [Sphingobacterium bovistauri]